LSSGRIASCAEADDLLGFHLRHVQQEAQGIKPVPSRDVTEVRDGRYDKARGFLDTAISGWFAATRSRTPARLAYHSRTLLLHISK
jgi:hypothetical protein